MNAETGPFGVIMSRSLQRPAAAVPVVLGRDSSPGASYGRADDRHRNAGGFVDCTTHSTKSSDGLQREPRAARGSFRFQSQRTVEGQPGRGAILVRGVDVQKRAAIVHFYVKDVARMLPEDSLGALRTDPRPAIPRTCGDRRSPGGRVDPTSTVERSPRDCSRYASTTARMVAADTSGMSTSVTRRPRTPGRSAASRPVRIDDNWPPRAATGLMTVRTRGQVRPIARSIAATSASGPITTSTLIQPRRMQRGDDGRHERPPRVVEREQGFWTPHPDGGAGGENNGGDHSGVGNSKPDLRSRHGGRRTQDALSAVRHGDGDARPTARRPVEARSVLGLPAMRPSLLDDLSAAGGRQTEARARKICWRIVGFQP